MRHSGLDVSKFPRHIQDQIVATLHGQKPPVVPLKTRAYPFTLWLDYRIPSLNRVIGKHWREAVKHRKVAEEAVRNALSVAVDCPKASGKIHLLITSYRLKLCDTDNFFIKAMNDQLRYAGLLIEDDPRSMAFTIDQNKVSKRELEGTKVTLTEALI